MKSLYIYCILIALVLVNTSCLKANLDELETYEVNDITNVRFEYRWWDEADKRMRVQEMEVEKTIDYDKKEISCTILVPEATLTFTSDIREKVSISELAINVDISTAARINPIGDSPVMGVFPSDFSAKEFTYAVMAGNGNVANWKIKILDFQK